MLVLGKDEKAKYPFLADAGRHLQEYGFELPQFGTDPALRVIVDKAYERVMAATGGSVYRSGLADGRAVQDRMLDVEILSFLIAIILIKLANRHTLVRRFALSEARRAESYLAGDLSDRRDRSRADMARRILHDLFGLKVGVRDSDSRYLIPVPDYLRHSSVFHEREWKLVNRQVEDGHVILRPDKTVRLIRHALTTYISAKIRNSPVPDMIPGLEEMVAELAAVADKLTPAYESTGENPPCIKHAINVLKSGENLPHSGRFMLATFLLARGRPIEEIAPLFKNAPDYSERVTMYQLNHLSGRTGGVKYNCPSCDKLRTQNLCFAVPECDGIITPLQFGRRRKTVEHEQQQPSDAEPAEGEPA